MHSKELFLETCPGVSSSPPYTSTVPSAEAMSCSDYTLGLGQAGGFWKETSDTGRKSETGGREKEASHLLNTECQTVKG